MPRQQVAPSSDQLPAVVPAPGAEFIGLDDNGYQKFRETVRVVKRKVPIMREDPETGRKFQVRRNAPGNNMGEPMFRIEWEEQDVEYTLVPQRTWMVRKNYHFQPSPEEQERIERREKVQQFQEDLAAAAIERGLQPDQLLDRLLDSQEPLEPPTVEVDEEGVDVSELSDEAIDELIEFRQPGHWWFVGTELAIGGPMKKPAAITKAREMLQDGIDGVLADQET